MTIETLGIDIAKTVFQLHAVNRNGRLILKRRVMRDQPQHVDDLPPACNASLPSLVLLVPKPENGPIQWGRITLFRADGLIRCNRFRPV